MWGTFLSLPSLPHITVLKKGKAHAIVSTYVGATAALTRMACVRTIHMPHIYMQHISANQGSACKRLTQVTPQNYIYSEAR